MKTWRQWLPVYFKIIYIDSGYSLTVKYQSERTTYEFEARPVKEKFARGYRVYRRPRHIKTEVKVELVDETLYTNYNDALKSIRQIYESTPLKVPEAKEFKFQMIPLHKEERRKLRRDGKKQANHIPRPRSCY